MKNITALNYDLDVYTTKDISKMFDVCEETVRRWIRSNRLECKQKVNVNNKNIEMFIYPTMLIRFLKANDKYMRIAKNKDILDDISKASNHEVLVMFKISQDIAKNYAVKTLEKGLVKLAELCSKEC